MTDQEHDKYLPFARIIARELGKDEDYAQNVARRFVSDHKPLPPEQLTAVLQTAPRPCCG